MTQLQTWFDRLTEGLTPEQRQEVIDGVNRRLKHTFELIDGQQKQFARRHLGTLAEAGIEEGDVSKIRADVDQVFSDWVTQQDAKRIATLASQLQDGPSLKSTEMLLRSDTSLVRAAREYLDDVLLAMLIRNDGFLPWNALEKRWGQLPLLMFVALDALERMPATSYGYTLLSRNIAANIISRGDEKKRLLRQALAPLLRQQIKTHKNLAGGRALGPLTKKETASAHHELVRTLAIDYYRKFPNAREDAMLAYVAEKLKAQNDVHRYTRSVLQKLTRGTKRAAAQMTKARKVSGTYGP